MSVDALSFQKISFDRATVTGVLSLMKRGLGHYLFRSFPSTDERRDRTILSKMVADFDDLKREIARGELEALEDVRIRVFEHLITASDATSRLVNGMVDAEVAVTLKLCWLGGQAGPTIRTLVRDSNSVMKRERLQAPNYFDYRDNSAFEKILTAN